MPAGDEETAEISGETIKYTCERCGFEYNKAFDYKPWLCYRCIRYIAKRTFTIMYTIQPPTSVADKGEV